MKTEELARFIITNLCRDKDLVKVQSFDDGEYSRIEILLKNEDLNNIKENNPYALDNLKRILYLSTSLHKEKRIKLNIEGF